jgi:hypothetical protein
VVGQEVPITSEARAEESPGVPLTDGADTDGTDSDGATTAVEERAVEAAAPGLSPEMNDRLTTELREVVGSDAVRVPADRPRASRGEHP